MTVRYSSNEMMESLSFSLMSGSFSIPINIRRCLPVYNPMISTFMVFTSLGEGIKVIWVSSSLF